MLFLELGLYSTKMQDQENKVIKYVLDAAQMCLGPCKVVLFGSRATRTAKQRSDFDFGILPYMPRSSQEWARFADLVSEEAPTLLNIDLVNLADPEISETLRFEVQQNGVVLNETREALSLLCEPLRSSVVNPLKRTPTHGYQLIL